MLADRGFSDELGKAGCAKAKELLGNGFFPGAAIAGGLAYAEGLDSGLSQHCAHVAAVAAAKVVDDIADADRELADAVADGEVPPVVLEQALAAARVAGRACRNGLDDAGFGKHNSSLKQHLRNRGFDEDLVDAAAKKAIDLHNMGYSPGAAFAGGIAYAEARRDGCSAYCADKAALAAARAAEEIGKTDRTVRAALARNDIPADVLALAVAAGREAAKRCMSGRDRFGPGGESDVGRKAADFLRRRGFPTDLQRAAYDKAQQLLNEGCSPGAALVGGIAYAEALDAGCSKKCADRAAHAAAKAAEDAGAQNGYVQSLLDRGEIPPATLDYCLAAGRAAAQACMAGQDDDDDANLDGLSLEELHALGYEVKLLGKNDEQLRKWELSAGKADETNVIAKLDAAFMPTKLGRAYDAVREASLDAAYRVDDALPVSATELSRRMVIQEHVIQERLAEEQQEKEQGGCLVM